MSFKAYLKVDGEKYELTACQMTVYRKADVKGKPASKSMWRLDILIDSVDDTNLTEWMVDPHMQKNGEIEILKIDEGDNRLKVIAFKKAHCTFMADSFYSYTTFMKCFLRIVGEKVTIGESSVCV